MSEVTKTARKPKAAPKAATAKPKRGGVAGNAKPTSATAKAATKTRAANARNAKAAKTPPAKTSTATKTGPTPARIVLAGKVAKLRKNGAKWNEIATDLDVSLSSLATLRLDVRNGRFAKVSPVASRVGPDAF
jgi:hypothetical protein